MVRLLLAVLFLSLGCAANPCTFSYGNYHVTYGMRDDSVHFRVSLSGIPHGYSGWTAIGFGQHMSTGIDVIVIRLMNGRVIVTDEFVQGFQSPYPDRLLDEEQLCSPNSMLSVHRVNNVITREASWANGQVVASFSRQLNTGEYPYDASLGGCSNWLFAANINRMSPQGHLYHHTQTPISQTVCLQQCRV